MPPLDPLGRLRDLAARRRVNPTDRVVVAVFRGGVLYRWEMPAEDLGLFDPQPPEADSDGLPANDQHRAILALLRERGPLKVASIASALGVDSAQLYRGPGDLKLLVQMGLVEKSAAGHALTAKGERAAGLLPGD